MGKRLALTWLSSLIVLLVLDAVWLGVVAGALYMGVLGDLMPEGFRIVPAALFYLLHTTGIVVFVLPIARQRHAIRAAAAFGAFFGICTYGTYDLTNQAVLRAWTTRLTVIDMAWGAVITATAALVGAWVDRRLRSPAHPETPSGSRR